MTRRDSSETEAPVPMPPAMHSPYDRDSANGERFAGAASHESLASSERKLLHRALQSIRGEIAQANERFSRVIAYNAELLERLRKVSDELALANHRASHDALTGLPNRTLLADRLQHGIELAKRNRQRIAVLMIDIDCFKHVNDRYGHAAGDALLRQFARRLQLSVRASDTVSRYGGDEFLVVLPDVGTAEDMAVAAEKIGAALEPPYQLADELVTITASMGVAAFPEDCTSGSTLIELADRAMYRRKSAGMRPA